MKIFKLPPNPSITFKATPDKSVWSKFYSWLRAELEVSDDYPLDVTNVYSSKSFEKVLENLIEDQIKRENPHLGVKLIKRAASLQILNYSPSNAKNVPEDEIWVNLKT